MHDTALAFAEKFFALYGRGAHSALDIGSMNVNGSLRVACPSHVRYVGVDLAPGPGVDVVVEDTGRLPLLGGEYDLVLSSSCLEHDPFFWQTFVEMARVLAPGGHIYLNVPSNGHYHRHPLDCWRFYPDAGVALERWCARQGHPVTLVESFVASRRDSEWNDCIAVFRKGPPAEPQRQYLHTDISNVTNVHVEGRSGVGAFRAHTEDQVLLSHFMTLAREPL